MLKLRTLSAAAALMLSSLTLAGCSPSSLEADCRATLENAKSFVVFEAAEWRFWPSTYATLNAGQGTRDSVKAGIQALYPGAQELVEKAEVAHTKEENNQKQYSPITDASAEAYVLENALKDNTTYTAAISAEEWKQISAGDETVLTPYKAFIDPAGDAEQTCSSFKSVEEELGEDPNYYFNDIVNDAQQSFMVLQEIHQCELYGEFDGYKCAGQDFVMEPSDGVESTTRNPFTDPYSSETTQGLAEFTWCYNQGLIVNASRTGCE